SKRGWTLSLKRLWFSCTLLGREIRKARKIDFSQSMQLPHQSPLQSRVGGLTLGRLQELGFDLCGIFTVCFQCLRANARIPWDFDGDSVCPAVSLSGRLRKLCAGNRT